MKHFHIRWSNPFGETLDWETFNTREEAQSAANQLRRPMRSTPLCSSMAIALDALKR